MDKRRKQEEVLYFTSTLGSESARRKQDQQRRDCHLSVVLAVTVALFLVFHSPRIIVRSHWKIYSVALENIFSCQCVRVDDNPADGGVQEQGEGILPHLVPLHPGHAAAAAGGDVMK